MEIYLTEQIFDRLLNSLAVELREYYEHARPVLVGVGISGVEIVGRMPSILKEPQIETYVCDVVRKKGKIEKIINFPNGKVKRKNVLICYVRVDTGKTLKALIEHAFSLGAKDIKTMSIAVRKGAMCFPNFFCFMIGNEDNLYLLLDGYPPDVELPYPPVIVSPGPVLRELRHEDAKRGWFDCGDERIDKFRAGDYLYFMKLSKRCRVFILDDGKNTLGVLHFSVRPKHVWIDTLAISKQVQGKHYGTRLMLFFIDWCRFHGIRWVSLDAFEKRERFYKMLGFQKVKQFEIPTYGRFCRMRRKVF